MSRKAIEARKPVERVAATSIRSMEATPLVSRYRASSARIWSGVSTGRIKSPFLKAFDSFLNNQAGHCATANAAARPPSCVMETSTS